MERRADAIEIGDVIRDGAFVLKVLDVRHSIVPSDQIHFTTRVNGFVTDEPRDWSCDYRTRFEVIV